MTKSMCPQINAAEFGRALLGWYAQEQRDLPWRHTKDPYRIWISEIMLQQTQVATVVSYYTRFLERFETVQALARASLDQVLSEWEGLGYYSRARNMHRAARQVADELAGVMPQDYQGLLGLSGIGEYTASAIASIAYGQDYAAVDGNVVRVIARLYDYDKPTWTSEGKQTLKYLAVDLLTVGRAGEHNQAMMELGATICTPRAPLCERCPVSQACCAYLRGTQSLRPIPKPRVRVGTRALVAVLTQREGRVLIVRRPPRGLLGGLWELPGWDLEGQDPADVLVNHLRSDLGLDAQPYEHLATVRHAYTHLKVTVQVYRCDVRGDPTPESTWDAVRWMAPDERAVYGLTGVTNKILDRVPWAGLALLL